MREYKSSEKARAAARAWRLANPERYKELQREARARKSGDDSARQARLAAYEQYVRGKHKANPGPAPRKISKIRAEDLHTAGRPWTNTERGRFKKHGIRPEQFAAMFERQGGGCAVCKQPEPPGVNSWHLDHDHETGAVRGILCITCNIALGMLRDDPARCRAAADYLDFSRL